MNDLDIIKSQYELRGEVQKVLGQPIRVTIKHDVYPCPFHNEKTVGAFQVEDEYFRCWSCGEWGDVLDWLSWVENKSLSELLKGENISLTPNEIKQKQNEIIEFRKERKEREEHLENIARDRLQDTERWIEYHNSLTEETRKLWRKRGIPDSWQDFWELGYSKNFQYKVNGGKAYSNTITIPVKAIGGKVLTIRHRLLSPLDGQKYRPDMVGLGSHPFICDTDLEKAKDIIIVEGEIKSQVVFLTNDRPGVQCIGIPSKSVMADTILKTKGRNTIVIPDPDSVEEMKSAAKQVGARFFVPPAKIDDWIVENKISTHELRNILSQARRI